MDIFLECMVKKKKDAGDYLFVAAMVILGIILSAAAAYITLLFAPFATGFGMLVIALIWYGVYILSRRRNIEYEYSFTNGILDVDVIYAKRTRNSMLTVRARDFIILAPVYQEQFREQYLNASGLIKRSYFAASSMSERRLYFADFIINAERVRLFFEPTRAMVLAMKRYNPDNIHVFDESEPL